MKIKTFSLLILLFTVSVSFAQTGKYSGPDNPIIPSDKEEVRIKLDQCIEDLTDQFTDNEAHDAAKKLCALREQHQAARENTLKGLAQLITAFKDVTNHDHSENLTQTIKLIQDSFKICMDTLESQEYCHNLTCLTDPENDAIFCNNQASSLINKILE